MIGTSSKQLETSFFTFPKFRVVSLFSWRTNHRPLRVVFAHISFLWKDCLFWINRNSFLECASESFLWALFNQEKIWIKPSQPYLNMNSDRRDLLTEKWKKAFISTSSYEKGCAIYILLCISLPWMIVAGNGSWLQIKSADWIDRWWVIKKNNKKSQYKR